MIALVLALALVSPAPHALRCAASCLERGDHYACFYELRPVCRRREVDCQDTVMVDCVPVSVSLGAWNPIPNEGPSRYLTSEPAVWGSYGGVYNVTPQAVP